MKSFLLLLSFLVLSTHALADSCLDKSNTDAAYKGEVESLLVASGLSAVPRNHIVATVTVDQSIHDPEYNVILNDGSIRHVTCDDSGDDQCGCDFVQGN